MPIQIRRGDLRVLPGILAAMSDCVLSELVELARRLGDPSADLAILAEGNVSARAGEGRFYVKSSGHSMSEIDASGFTLVDSAPIMAALAGSYLTDREVRTLLSSSRVDEASGIPSVETFMHAYLLSLPEVSYVGHTHPTPLVSLLGLADAEQISAQRLFPDEVVCCGPATAFVPYADPGLPLARAIKQRVEAFIEVHEMVPKTIWLQNHGLIAAGKTVRDVQSATFMGVKAARAWLGALSTGKKLSPLSPENVSRIHTRPDEHYRQQLLWSVDKSSK